MVISGWINSRIHTVNNKICIQTKFERKDFFGNDRESGEGNDSLILHNKFNKNKYRINPPTNTWR